MEKFEEVKVSYTTKIFWKFSLYLILLVVLSILPLPLQAATLSFSPSSGSYTVTSTFPVAVYVSSSDQAVNAASGVILFPADTLEVVSISKNGSIIGLWAQEPSFSNSEGRATFEGIILNPGFRGQAGKIITITFKVKATRSASLTFSSASVLANDGQGTNILTTLGNASFFLGSPDLSALESTTVAETAGTPGAPRVFSSSHPDPNKWYAQSLAKFTWTLPSDVTEASLLMSQIPQAIPTVMYVPAVSSKEIDNVVDGIWYFHARLRNALGWGSTSHLRFQIDTEKPYQFTIEERRRQDLTEPRATFVFGAKDRMSGIDYYEVQIDGESPHIWREEGKGFYETPVVGPGRHTLIAKAVDKAGNSLADSVEFMVEALETPRITEYPKKLASGEILTIKGITKYPGIQVVFWLQREKDEPQSQRVQSEEKGSFTLIAEGRLRGGLYNIWAKVLDERGAQSNPTSKVTIAVERPAILSIGSWAITLLAVMVPLVALILLLGFLFWYGWHRFSLFKKRLRREVREAEQALQNAFDLFKKDVKKQVQWLEKIRIRRQLTEEEEKIIKQLRKDLDDAEKSVRKEIKDIGREIQ